MALSFILLSLVYTGLINTGERVIDCSKVLNKYTFKGIPSLEEDKVVKECCNAVRKLSTDGLSGELLYVHLRICRQLGR